MKNINDYLPLLVEFKSIFAQISKKEEKTYETLCKLLEIDPEEHVGLTLFDYLHNGTPLRHWYNIYREHKDKQKPRKIVYRDMRGRFCRGDSEVAWNK